MNKYESNRSRNCGDAENVENPSRDSRAFWPKQKADCEWVTRYNKAQVKLSKGILPGKRGRPRKDGQPPHEDEVAELKRLRMENQLLRDFLRFTEGK